MAIAVNLPGISNSFSNIQHELTRQLVFAGTSIQAVVVMSGGGSTFLSLCLSFCSFALESNYGSKGNICSVVAAMKRRRS